MVTHEEAGREQIWCCPRCRNPLVVREFGFDCSSCGKHYPIIAGVPILVSEPAAYLRSELAALSRTVRDGRLRRASMNRMERELGLSDVSLERHRDVIDAEVARAETFLVLLEPAVRALEAMGSGGEDTLAARRSGWAFDTLLPYLLRDWTDTSELKAARSAIGAALDHAFPDPSGKSVVFAGCGASGLLAEIAMGFARVLGFDLTLPVLAAARHLLDGGTLDLALPRAINEIGRISLGSNGRSSVRSNVEIVAMDVFDTAFADGAVDCVITSFLIDLIPDPRKLAEEIHRILSGDGVWINYGPSGPLKALWRFDGDEGAAFIEAAGFTVLRKEAYRATYLDLSRDCPSWSFQSHICYLTSARKSRQPEHKTQAATAPPPAGLAEMVPQHFSGANLIQRQTLGTEQTAKTVLRYERLPGRPESVEIGDDAARIMTLVDGTRTVGEIAELLQERKPSQSADEIVGAFAQYFRQGLLTWRGRDE